MRTIKDVQFELKVWGDFWSRKEQGQGYASKSNVQSVKETCEVGCASSSTLHLFSHTADSIFVPEHIQKTTIHVDLLKKEYRKVIIKMYVKKIKRVNFLDYKSFKDFKDLVTKAERYFFDY